MVCGCRQLKLTAELTHKVVVVQKTKLDVVVTVF